MKKVWELTSHEVQPEHAHSSSFPCWTPVVRVSLNYAFPFLYGTYPRVPCVTHDDVIKWKHFPRNWPFVRGIHRFPVNSPHKDQWRGALMFFFYLCLNKRLSKQSWGWWFETLSRSLWRHRNERHVTIIDIMGRRTPNIDHGVFYSTEWSKISSFFTEHELRPKHGICPNDEFMLNGTRHWKCLFAVPFSSCSDFWG